MASLTRLADPTPPASTWDTPGPAVVLLRLDHNELAAVEWALFCKGLTSKEASLKVTDPGSILGAGARVHRVISAWRSRPENRP